MISLIAQGGCRGPGQGAGAPALIKLSPAAVSVGGAFGAGDRWVVFDRSLKTGLGPATAEGSLRAEFARAETVSAIKVYGPAPYRLEVTGDGSESLGFPAVDLSALTQGWHIIRADAPTQTKTVTLALTPVGDRGRLAEVEIWGEAQSRRARTASAARAATMAASDSPPPQMATADAAPKQAELWPPSKGQPTRACAVFRATLPYPPALYRRAYLVYESKSLFRPFSARRWINGGAEQGAAWLSAGAGRRENVEEIDPSSLALGKNAIRFCLPQQASTTVTLSSVRLVGELDRGVDQATRVAIGGDEQVGEALLDGDPDTTAEIAAGEKVLLSFDRLIAPDAITITGEAPDSAEVACVGRSDTTPLAAHLVPTDSGAVIGVDGGASACRALSLTLSNAVTASEIDVAGSGAGEPVDWPRIVVASAREHFGTVAWVGGFTEVPPEVTGAIRVEVGSTPSPSPHR